MWKALNAACFADPQWLLRAKGHSGESGGISDWSGGIVMPRRVHLAVGQRYFRFASATTDREAAQLGGGWWLDYENLRQVTAYMRAVGGDPRQAVRLALAVPWQWNTLDRLVHAILSAPLDAYTGQGRRAEVAPPGMPGAHFRDCGVPYTPAQHLRIRQLFIPGLAAARGQAFPQPTIEPLGQSSYLARG